MAARKKTFSIPRLPTNEELIKKRIEERSIERLERNALIDYLLDVTSEMIGDNDSEPLKIKLNGRYFEVRLLPL